MYQSYRCPNCSTQITEGINSCPECGTYIFPSIPDETYEYPPNFTTTRKSNKSFNIVIAISLIATILVVVFAIAFISFTGVQNKEKDNIVPTIVRTEPADGAMDVEPQFSLKIFFNEPMTRCTTLHYDFWQIATTETETRWINDETAEITNLMFQEFGSVTIRFFGDTNLVDSDGNGLAEDYEWTFTTRPVKVDIISSTTYHHPNSTVIHAYGELRNQESFNISFMEFNVIAYDYNHNVIGTQTKSTFTSPNIIKPNEIVPYIGFYMYQNGIAEVEVEIINNAYIGYASLYEGLDIIMDKGSLIYYGNDSYYLVNGTVKNNGDQVARWVIVASTFYDSQGQIICALQYVLGSEDIDINQTANFEIDISNLECDVLTIDSYSLRAFAHL